MAKPSSSSSPDSPRVPAPPGAGVVLGHGVLKLAAFVVGLPAAQLSVMALVGALTPNGYARFIGAAVAVLVVPLVIADRLLPAHDPTRARGLVSDVCAVTWMLVVFGVAGAGGAATRPLLLTEGDRLAGAGHAELARGAYLLAGARLQGAPDTASGAPSGSAASPTAGPADAGTAAPVAADGGGPKAKGPDKTPAELFKEASPSVVTINVSSDRMFDGGGTGFLIDKDGTIATNHHVIEGATRVRVKFASGSIFEQGELLVDDPNADLALLRVDLERPLDGSRVDVTPLALGNSDEVVVGEHAVVIGNPLGLESTLTDGLVSSRRMYVGRPWIQFSAPIGSGNSGGPVLNMRGEVIGVTTASLSHGMIAQNLNLAVPVNELKKLIRTEYPNKKKLGEGAGAGHW